MEQIAWEELSHARQEVRPLNKVSANVKHREFRVQGGKIYENKFNMYKVCDNIKMSIYSMAEHGTVHHEEY